MSFNLIKIIHEMSWFALGIAGALVAMAASLAVFVERLRADALPSAPSRTFADRRRRAVACT